MPAVCSHWSTPIGQFDYMLLGLLVYEMATGKRPFADIYSLSTVVLAVVHDKVKLNVEADHFLQKHNSPVSNSDSGRSGGHSDQINGVPVA